MTKQELIDIASGIQASNWIKMGDAEEFERDAKKQFMRRALQIFTKGELINRIKNTTIYDKDLEDAVAGLGLR